MLEHPNIVGTKWEIRGREENWKRTLVVMTDLTLNPDSEDYDATAEGELLAAVGDYWKGRLKAIDAINIRSTRAD